MVEVEIGVDLFAFAELIATLRDWLAICQPNVPAVDRLGVSMPAVTTKLEMTKQDMRNGKKTGSPVSVVNSVQAQWLERKKNHVKSCTWVDGCIDCFLCFP